MPVHILAAARTPLGAFGGALKSLSASELGAHALRAVLRLAQFEADQIDEVILGCALPIGIDGPPARTAALAAGIPPHVPTHTPCAGALSGLKAVVLAAQGLQYRNTGFMLAGGTESPSRAPYLLPNARWGVRMGEADLLDSLLLVDPSVALEAACLGFERKSLDSWIEASRRKAIMSREARNREIAPLSVPGRYGTTQLVIEDEPPEASRIAPTPHLAAPADGAAALLLASVPPPGAAPLAHILDWAETGSGCAEAIRQLLLRTGFGFPDIDRWEIREASAAHALALLGELPELDPARLNTGGSALALGDPLGASGACLLTSLALALQSKDLRRGIVGVQGDNGQALALAISRS